MFNRSLTPHLSLYRSQFTSTMSIFHRLSGLALALFLLCIPILLSITFTLLPFNLFYAIYSFVLVKVVSFFSLFFVCYHLANGIRHVFWDLCIGLNIHDINATGSLILFVSSLLVLLLITF